MDEWIEAHRTELLSGEHLSARTLARIVRQASYVDERDIELARNLTSADVDFLDGWQIQHAISADLTEEQLLASAAKNRDRYTRIGYLLPEVILQIRDRSNFALRYTVQRISDLVHDFSIDTQRYPRRDKIVNGQFRSLSKFKTLLRRALTDIATIKDDHLTAQEYETQAWAANNSPPLDDEEALAKHIYPEKLEHLLAAIELVTIAVEIVDHDLRSEMPREAPRSYGMGKRDVVSLVYDLHINCKGPPLVTTPGSNFSHLCSLIYEMATGESDHSLAGAIIDFSRSRERTEEDDYQVELLEDEAAVDIGDNFHSIRGSIKRARKDAEWYASAAQNESLEPKLRIALLRTAVVLLDSAERQANKFGPFIVWADQIPATTREAWHLETEAMHERLRQGRILLGQARRARRNQS